MGSKPILCLDFDGVIHSYDSGWRGAYCIPDLPVPGAIEFIVAAQEVFRVAIYSTRSNAPAGPEAMAQWLRFHAEKVMSEPQADDMMQALEWPTEKLPAFVTIDDRAISFEGAWPSISALRGFKPWNKRA